MARTNREIPMGNKSIDEILVIFKNAMTTNKFSEKLVKNEKVWAKGDGVLMKMQCFSISFKEKSFVLQGWLRDALTGESDLTGFVAMVLKKKMIAIMDQIEQSVTLKRINR